MISIVIPVFNAEKYLSKVLESVVNQSYKDFECIVVDDGSKDESLSIAKSYETRDSRFQVFHKENGGVSSARNYGIEMARGEFIYFIDSDDELFNDALSILAVNMNDGIDLVFGGFVRCDEKGVIQYSTDGNKTFTTSVKGALDIVAFPSKYYQTLGMPWLNLFKRSVIMKHNIRYDISYGAIEDRVFLVSYICVCEGHITFTTRPVYKYFYNRSGSIMNTRYQSFKASTLSMLDARIAILKKVRNYRKSSKMIYEATLAVFYTYQDLVSYVRRFNRTDLESNLKIKVDSVLSRPLYLALTIRDRLKCIMKKVVFYHS